MASTRPTKTAKTAIALCFGIGFALSAATLPIAPEASLLIFCLTLFCGFWMMENTRRFRWEASNTFKIRKIEQDAKSFAETLDAHDHAIEILKNDIAALKRKPLSEAIALTKPVLTKAPEPNPLHKRTYNDLFNLETVPVRRAPKVAVTPSNDGYSPAVVEELLNQALRPGNNSGSVEVFVQPVMRLPARQPQYFELSPRLRARPGSYVAPPAGHEKQRELDTILLLRALDLVKSDPRPARPTPFVLSLPGSMLTSGPFIRTLLPFLAKNRWSAGRFMFAVPYADFTARDKALATVMEGLARLGCAFMLDIESDIPEKLPLEPLMHYRIKAFRAPASLFGKAFERPKILHLKSRLEGNGISFILSGIESEHALRDLLEASPNLGQGSLFGRPDLQGAYLKTIASGKRI